MTTSPVLVVFPVYNEAKNLERMLTSLVEVVRQERYDLVAINDASTDESLEILNRHGIPTITLIERLGYGAVGQTGYKYALDKGYEYLIQLDGDGQHDPRFLSMIYQKLQAFDFVIGSRFLEHTDTPFSPEEKLYEGTALRRIAMRWFRMVLYLRTRVSLSDPTSGYIGVNRKCLLFLSGDHFPHDYPDADVCLTLIRNQFKLCEIPVYMYHNDATGTLHIGVKPVWYMFKMMLSLFISSIASPPTPTPKRRSVSGR